MHTSLCCLYLEVFHKVPGQNTWSDFVYLLGVSRELVSDESSVTGTLDPQFKMVPNMKENRKSAPWFQYILAFFLTLGWFRIFCGCKRQPQGRVYLGGFQPYSPSKTKGFWSQMFWLCVTAPFCAFPRKGKEWNLGTNSLSQMPWGNPQVKHRLVQFVPWSKVNLVVFIFKSIFYS